MRYRDIVTSEAAAQSATTKPVKPLTPAKQRCRQEKNSATQKRIRDEVAASAKKITDLRAKLR